MFAVNAIGPVFLVRCLRKQLGAAKGKVVNISSEAGALTTVSGPRPIMAYAASKAALNMFIRRISFELADEGIFTASVHPGWMNTPMERTAGAPTDDPAVTAENVLKLADRMDRSMSGGFFWHHGEPYPW